MFLSPRFFCLSANEFFQTDVSHDSHFDRTMGVVMTVGMTGLLALTYVPPLGYLLRLCHAKPSPRCQRWDSLESSVVFAIAIALVTGTGTSNWHCFFEELLKKGCKQKTSSLLHLVLQS